MVLLLTAAQAAEKTVDVNGVQLVVDSITDELLGFNDVTVALASGDQAYDIRFADGTCTEVYGLCTMSSLDFQTQNDARAAGTALLAAIDATSGDPDYDFDDDRRDIAGCGAAFGCETLISHQVVLRPDSSFLGSVYVRNALDNGFDFVSITGTTAFRGGPPSLNSRTTML
ncbi:MAG: hypothetical protein AAF225_07625 [Pseudomonadota bacterium]